MAPDYDILVVAEILIESGIIYFMGHLKQCGVVFGSEQTRTKRTRTLATLTRTLKRQGHMFIRDCTSSEK